ncbi:response regulator [Anaeromyxobacter oryzae]|uniref:Uncharacterized protein n=1 Tax=Anaeromyxobacter oryzae TaxID=2918170 RepID=A0ABM7WP79_9BACT|nr:response regulator [Anaeromyxobacter oryzae]BDG01277.1 hypothetical protein AMOR_02730 [Anaeromyxobacter oryzae]
MGAWTGQGGRVSLACLVGVLVVEDQPDDRETLRDLLELLGAEAGFDLHLTKPPDPEALAGSSWSARPPCRGRGPRPVADLGRRRAGYDRALRRRRPPAKTHRMAKSWADVHEAARVTAEALHREAAAARAQAEAARERAQALLAVADANRREAQAAPDEYFAVSRWHQATLAETRARGMEREAAEHETEARTADAEADTAHARSDASRARADREGAGAGR